MWWATGGSSFSRQMSPGGGCNESQPAFLKSDFDILNQILLLNLETIICVGDERVLVLICPVES